MKNDLMFKTNYEGIDGTLSWFEKVIPEPNVQNFIIQYSVMLEEVVEGLDALGFPSKELNEIIEDLRAGNYTDFIKDTFWNIEKNSHKHIEFLDSLADVYVTTIGTAHTANYKIKEAIDEVNKSNWSKFDLEGNPIFNEFGKISKGSNYLKPNLEPYV